MELFVPYTIFGGETNLDNYRFALGVRALHWFDEGFEVPYGVLCEGDNNNFNNNNIQTWAKISDYL